MLDKILSAIFGQPETITINKGQIPAESKFISPIPQPSPKSNFLSPLPNEPEASPVPVLDKIVEKLLYRNPKIEGYLNNPNRAIKSDELLSGTKIASEESGIPQELLMDVAGLESTAGTLGGKENSSGAAGPFQFLKSTGRSVDIEPEDRYSATESARAFVKMLQDKRLSEFDIIDKPGAGGDRLTDFYSEEELAPYVSDAGKERRSMLQEIANGLFRGRQ